MIDSKRITGTGTGLEAAGSKAGVPAAGVEVRTDQLEEMITRRHRLDQVNEGYQDMLDGKNLRGVIGHGH